MRRRTGFWHVFGRLMMLAMLASLCATRLASAQALGDVAKKEEERRKTVKSSGKVYTNGNIRPDPNAPAPSSGAQGASTPSTATPSSGESERDASADTRKKDEEFWRKKIGDEREALQRAQAFSDALESQVNALNTDFVSRDDPAQRAVIATKRDRATAELARAKREVETRTKAVTAIQEEARRAGVPPGWVR